MALDTTQQEIAPRLESPDEEAASAPRKSGSLGKFFFRSLFVRVPVLLLLFTAAACFECKYMTALSDSDVWIYLRTGEWILQNHTVPHTSLFTQYTGRPWIAYSWGFDVLAALAYKAMGLRAVPVMLACFKVALAVIVFLLAGGTRRNFWLAVLLCAAAQYTIPDLEARPGFLSVLFLAVELILLFKSRRMGSVRPLYWLPVLFVFWANCHIQFMNGLFVLGLFLAGLTIEALLQSFDLPWLKSGEKKILPLTTIAIVTASCIVTTLLSPYSYHLYAVAWQYAHSTAAYSYIAEMHAMNFRETQHYARLLLAMVAFFSLGRNRSRDLFKLALLIAGVVIAFHARRDAWFLVLPSIAVIADAFSSSAKTIQSEDEPATHPWRWEIPLTAALVALVLTVAIAHYVPSNREALLARVGQIYPVRACDMIRDNHLPQPIFNPLTWGGFVMWYLPEHPVSTDGRVDLYGDDVIIRQYEILDSERSPMEEPTFAGAHTILLKSNSPLTWNLARSGRYRPVYRDEMATVFVRGQ